MQVHCKYAMNDRVRVMNMEELLSETTQTLRERREIRVAGVTITANLCSHLVLGGETSVLSAPCDVFNPPFSFDY